MSEQIAMVSCEGSATFGAATQELAHLRNEIRSISGRRGNAQQWTTLAAEIHQLYLNHGIPLEKLSAAIGTSASRLSTLFKNHGLPARPVGHRTVHASPPKRKFAVSNARAFRTIDAPETAYWLGMCWADGYLMTKNNMPTGLRLLLKESDRGHVAALKNFLGAEQEVFVRESRLDGKVHDGCCLEIYHAELGKDLHALGLRAHRGEIGIPFPDVGSYKLEFLVGLWDGDGHLQRQIVSNFFLSGWEVGFAGPEISCRVFLQFIESITGRTYPIQKNGKKTKNRRVAVVGPAALLVMQRLGEIRGPRLARKAELIRLLCHYFELAMRTLTIRVRGDGMRFHGNTKAVQDAYGEEFWKRALDIDPNLAKRCSTERT